jgi:peroxiredoxin
MKKPWIRAALAVVLSVALYFVVFREPASAPPAPAAAPAPRAATVPASDLPDLTVTRLDNASLRIKELKGRNILILFQPDCDHCQRETREIKANLPAFQDYTLYFVSNYPAEQLRQFANDYQLAAEPNVVFGTTTVEAILQTLGPQPSPSVYIYDGQGRLVKSFLGETKVEKILPFL